MVKRLVIEKFGQQIQPPFYSLSDPVWEQPQNKLT